MQPAFDTAVSVDTIALRAWPRDDRVSIGVAPRAFEPFAQQLALPGVLLGRGERLVAAAARAVVTKLGVPPEAVVAAGQLATFDEPNRDPRGPTLSIAMWAVIGEYEAGQVAESGDAGEAPRVEWFGIGELPDLAFDHNRIVAQVRGRLCELLWHDAAFTRALTGQTFPASRAVALTSSLIGSRPDQGNLNRTLRSVKGLERTDERVRTNATGRPAAVWTWTA